MRSQNNMYILYVILAVLVFGIAYTACMDITPQKTLVEKNIELKLTKWEIL